MSESIRRPPRKSVVGRPRPGQYLLAGFVSGFLAGVALIALTSWYSSYHGSPELMPFRYVASLAQGPTGIPTHTLWIGMAVHSVLSALLGLVFAIFTSWIRSASLVALAGLVFGAAVYIVDFQILARVVTQFSAFRTVDQPFMASVHLVFGAVLAVLVLLGARRDAGLRPYYATETERRTEV
ncbi:MAG TPA: hypothetical protein VFX52_11550 [Nocardioidaceae bacterium]|jgi:hypothetical protein|nr:hypothetical protein [Nocardioidaceae bacterium]